MKLILTCEHGGNEIPQKYHQLFSGAKAVLNSHRGYDPGTLDLFEHLLPLADFGKSQIVSRLLVEMNRSVGHPQLFSEFTEKLSTEEKKELLETYYFPYRNAIEEKIGSFIQNGENVLHLSVHSFAPILNGKKRAADIGLLYDPKRISEKEFCKKLKTQLQEGLPDLKIRMNYPYLGTTDGFTTYLRKKFPQKYVGIELEVNQQFSSRNKMDNGLKSGVCERVKKLLEILC